MTAWSPEENDPVQNDEESQGNQDDERRPDATSSLEEEADPGPFREHGRSLGMVYQAADDVRDRIGSSDELGKPVGRDEALGRPSVVRARGLEAALIELDRRTEAARAAVPPCPGRDGLAAFVARLLAGFQP